MFVLSVYNSPMDTLGESRLALFGTRKQTLLLMLLALLEESYLRELARLARMSPSEVSRVVENLELQGVLATRLIGKERRVSLNPRFFAVKPLRELLLKMADVEPAVQDAVLSIRRRPRRKGKPH